MNCIKKLTRMLIAATVVLTPSTDYATMEPAKITTEHTALDKTTSHPLSTTTKPNEAYLSTITSRSNTSERANTDTTPFTHADYDGTELLSYDAPTPTYKPILNHADYDAYTPDITPIEPIIDSSHINIIAQENKNFSPQAATIPMFTDQAPSLDQHSLLMQPIPVRSRPANTMPEQQTPATRLATAQKQAVAEIATAVHEQASTIMPAAELADIQQTAIITSLQANTTAQLTELLFNAPTHATQDAPITRSHIWSAITKNIADSLGISKAGKVINAQFSNICAQASKTLDAILGDRTITDGVKQSRSKQLINNLYTTLQNIAKTMQHLSTQASDLVSGSKTTIERDEHNNIISKIVTKPDHSIVTYQYKDGKLTNMTNVIRTLDITTEPTSFTVQRKEKYNYDADGKIISTSSVTRLPEDWRDIKNDEIDGKKIKSQIRTRYSNATRTYDAQGQLALIKKINEIDFRYTTTTGKTIKKTQPDSTEFFYHKNGKRIGTLTMKSPTLNPEGQNIYLEYFDNKADTIRWQKTVPKPTAFSWKNNQLISIFLNDFEPVFDTEASELIGWNGNVVTDEYGSIKQIRLPDGRISLVRYDQSGKLIHSTTQAAASAINPIPVGTDTLATSMQNFYKIDDLYKNEQEQTTLVIQKT